jgi:hypothetical protein
VEEKFDVEQPVFVVTDLTGDETIKDFVKKVQEQEAKTTKIPMIQRDNTWRVFFPNNLPELLVWTFDWEKRKDYLLDMTKGDRTLKKIGITAENN